MLVLVLRWCWYGFSNLAVDVKMKTPPFPCGDEDKVYPSREPGNWEPSQEPPDDLFRVPVLVEKINNPQEREKKQRDTKKKKMSKKEINKKKEMFCGPGIGISSRVSILEFDPGPQARIDHFAPREC